VNISGGGIGWIHNDIWLKREAPEITVVKGSIHDNPLLDKDTVERTLARFPEEERRAREFGDFVHIGGMVFPGGFEQYLVDPPSPKRFQTGTSVVGMDPGFEERGVHLDGVRQGQPGGDVRRGPVAGEDPADYVKAIRATNLKWGIKDPLYVIDPSARNRATVNAENVEAVLQSLGIYPMHAMNAVEAGIQQMRLRLQKNMWRISRDCRGLRGEADLYRMKDRPDGHFEVVKENDHRLDSARYGSVRACGTPQELQAPRQQLGYQPGVAPSLKDLESMYVPPSHPLGTMA
jgi:hypothetical protein